jgi:copper chaperone CopZ
MKNQILFTLLVFFVCSCSSEPEVVHLRTVKHNDKKKAEVKANCTALIDIKGMSCEMGCGGSIRKALKATKAVARVSYDFMEGREVQVAKIEFDSTQLNTKQIETIISELNDQQFKVLNIRRN